MVHSYGFAFESEPFFRFYNSNRFRRRALLITLMLENAIAPAAKMGLSSRKKSGAHSNGAKMPAAMGISAILYPNAQPKFCLIFRIVACDR